MRILDLIRKMNCTKGKVLYAGYNSYQMEGVLVIPKTVEYIEFRTFHSCHGLTKVHIPYSTAYIGEHAFDGCLELCRIEIPETIVSIGACAFCQCAKLVHIFYKGINYTEKDAIIYRLQHDDVMVNHSAFAS